MLIMADFGPSLNGASTVILSPVPKPAVRSKVSQNSFLQSAHARSFTLRCRLSLQVISMHG